MALISGLLPDNLPAGRRHDDGGSLPAPAAHYLLYSHDGVGLGHVRRNLNIATALRSIHPDAAVLLATGADELDAFPLPDGVDALRLPGIRKVDNATYAARRLAVSADELHALRAGVLSAAVEAYQPDVLVADKHPAGAQGELLPALGRLRAAGGRAVLGLRDVLDDPERTRREWNTTGAARHVAELYDQVFVYGQQDILDPLIDCGLPESVRDRARFCGYVVAEHRPVQRPHRNGRQMIAATVGGGEDGAPVLRTFIEAARDAPWDAIVITGPKMPASERAVLEGLAGGQVRLVSSVRDLGVRLSEVDAVLCMGGYNTLAEVLAAAVPAVCVPRVYPRTEQQIRARLFNELGLVRLVEPAELGPDRLRMELDAALRTDRAALADRVRATIDFGGARRTAEMLADLATTARPRATARPVAQLEVAQ